jgi:hypothetical protein
VAVVQLVTLVVVVLVVIELALEHQVEALRLSPQ